MPVKGSKRIVGEDGTVTFELPEDAMKEVEETGDANPPVAEEETFAVTRSTLTELIAEGVGAALKEAGVGPKVDPGPIRNADIQAANAPMEGMQTQDAVDLLGISTDGRTHGPNFIPGVPEWISAFDMKENAGIIGECVNAGYRVTLVGVEFKAEWWPTEWRTIGDREIEFRVKKDIPAEPPENAELLVRLQKTIPRYCATFILEHREERTVGSEQKLQRLVDQYTRAGFQRNPGTPDQNALNTMNSLRAQAGAMPAGGDLNIDLGHQAGAAAVEGVRVQ